MIYLADIMAAVNFKVQGGGNYLWSCYGPNAQFMDFGVDENLEMSVSCVFDTSNQEVYEITVCPRASKMYRWINPQYLEVWKEECVSRKIEEELEYTDVEDEDDILNKAEQAMGVKVDASVPVEIHVEPSLMNKLFMLAHQNAMTLNQLVNVILTIKVGEIEEDNQN